MNTVSPWNKLRHIYFGLCLTLASATFAVLVPAPALAQGTWAQATEVTLPANANASPSAGLNGVSCWSAGNCTATGSYTDSSGNDQGMAATETSGTWAQATEVTLPANANASPSAFLDGVSCWSAGNCTATGSYTDSSGNDQGMAATETSGRWAQATEVTAPANASASLGAFLRGVSCSSAGNCTATGLYYDSSGTDQGMAATETSGTWAQAIEVTLPANANAQPSLGAFLNGVSCWSAGNCTATGSYFTNSNNFQAMAATETSGRWAQATEVTVPANASTGSGGPAGDLYGVSCWSAGNCTATGQYYDSSGNFQAMAATETSGTWAQATEVTAPVNAQTDYGEGLLNGVSCSSAGNCTATGSYITNSSNFQAMAATETSGTWAQATEVTAPANADNAGFFEAGLGGVSCWSAGNCTATGSYTDSSGNHQAMAATETSGIVTVAFVSEGGAGLSVLSGPPGSVITLPLDTRPGYTLYGWYTAPFGGTLVGRAGWAYTIPSGGITLYAHWTANNAVTVAFVSEGGAGLSVLSGPPGSVITLPLDTRPGYTLYGWYTAPFGGTLVGRAGWAYTIPSGGITLYAHWTANNAVTVAFVSEGGAGLSVLSGPPGSVITLPLDTRPGYTLYGWYTAPFGGTLVGRAGWAYTIPSGGITLYAHWTANNAVTVAFVSEGGAGLSVLSGPPGSVITLPLDTRPGYTLYGWYTAPFGGTLVGRAGWAYTIPSGGITLYAHWNPVSLADLTGSFSGMTTPPFPEHDCVELPSLPQSFGAVYPGNSAVGAVTLGIVGCDIGLSIPLSVTGTFSIATDVGTLRGNVSGSMNLLAPPTVGWDFELTLTVVSGTGAFAATTGTIHVSIQWTPNPPVNSPVGAPQPVTGSVTIP